MLSCFVDKTKMNWEIDYSSNYITAVFYYYRYSNKNCTFKTLQINMLEEYAGIKVSKLVSHNEMSVRARDYQIKTYQLHINKV